LADRRLSLQVPAWGQCTHRKWPFLSSGHPFRRRQCPTAAGSRTAAIVEVPERTYCIESQCLCGRLSGNELDSARTWPRPGSPSLAGSPRPPHARGDAHGRGEAPVATDTRRRHRNGNAAGDGRAPFPLDCTGDSRVVACWCSMRRGRPFHLSGWRYTHPKRARALDTGSSSAIAPPHLFSHVAAPNLCAACGHPRLTPSGWRRPDRRELEPPTIRTLAATSGHPRRRRIAARAGIGIY
jgi:hypothetical protein